MNILKHLGCSIQSITTRVLVVCCALFTALHSTAQRSDESTANEIYSIVFNTTWEKELSAKQFVIGVLDNDTTLYALLKRKFQGIQVHRKTVKVSHFGRLDELEPSSVLVVDKKFNKNIKAVYNSIPETGCLLITTFSNKSPYNMIDFNGRLRKGDYSANRENLGKAGLRLADIFKEPGDVQAHEEIVAEASTVDQQSPIEAVAKSYPKLKPAAYYKNLSLQEKIALLDKQTDLLQDQEKKINTQDSIVRMQAAKLIRLNTEVTRQEKKLGEQQTVLGKQEATILVFIVMLGLIALAAVLVLNTYRNNRKLLVQLSEKNAFIEDQNAKMVDVLNNVTDSIRYAHKIQHAVLPGTEQREEQLNNKKHFVMFKPKDIVSGDFYFVEKKEDKTIVAVADCTGHGVPGAFVGMLCQGLLHQIVQHAKQLEPAVILNELRRKVIHALQQKGLSGEQMDGLDISLLIFDHKKNSCQWAGANNSLYQISAEGKLTEYKPDRRPISIYPDMRDFTNVVIDVAKGDRFFLFSDGFQDQFGGPNGKKFMSKNFKRTLETTCALPIELQGKELEKILDNWMEAGGRMSEQIDDITVFGIEV